MLNLEVGEVHNLLSNNNLGRLNNNIASRRRNEATDLDYFRHEMGAEI
jgi:hypothetical protein